MSTPTRFRGLLLVTAGTFLGVATFGPWIPSIFPPAAVTVTAQEAPAQGAAAPATPAEGAPARGAAAPGRGRVNAIQLQADVNRLKELVPSQSHTMMDVGYNWTNLWFAAQKQNWPLAQFYFDEARAHILWTIKIRPIRLNPDRTEVDIQGIFTGIDSSSMNAVREAIAKQDSAAFDATYRTMLESCYACHKAVAKPYLRLAIPQVPASTIINFDPAATWPQ